jgi:hypothetical protein
MGGKYIYTKCHLHRGAQSVSVISLGRFVMSVDVCEVGKENAERVPLNERRCGYPLIRSSGE